MSDISDDELMKRFMELVVSFNYDEVCGTCTLPTLLHKGACTRKEAVEPVEYGETWKMFRIRMKPIIAYQREVEYKNGLNLTLKEISEAVNKENKPARLIKQVRVPVWSKHMRLDDYNKQLDIWNQNHGDVEEHVKYQEVINVLTANKEVIGL